VPKAYIILKETGTLNQHDVIKYLREHLALYKIPKFVEFKEAFPRTATRKVLKRALREK